MLVFSTVLEDFFVEFPKDSPLPRLFRAALRGIKEEMSQLGRAFAQAPNSHHDFYKKGDHGLGHWLFESSLPYTVFKAWIPFVQVTWEKPYEDGAAPFDLVVYEENGSHNTKSWTFETKWWMDRIDATTLALKTDFSHMEQWKEERERRILLGCWYWTKEAFDERRDEIRVFKRETAAHMGHGEIELLALGAFPVDFHHVESLDEEGYLCMGFFRVKAKTPTP